MYSLTSPSWWFIDSVATYSLGAPRILYVPNETGDFRQWGFRRALTQMRDDGLLSEVAIFSLLWRLKTGNQPEAKQQLLHVVQRFEPDIMLIQHPGQMGLDDRFMDNIAGLPKRPRIIYHEGDPYTRYRHRLPPEGRSVARHSDHVFTVGSGRFARLFRTFGARDVRWTPHTFAPAMFGNRDIPEVRMNDIVVIANAAASRNQLRGLPGSRARIEFIESLRRQVPNTVIYGRGWKGPGAMGPSPFYAQEATNQTAWVSANWDHYPREPGYFSDRLPIAMASGNIHATTEHPGYREIFGDAIDDFLFLSADPELLIDLCKDVIALPSKEKQRRCNDARALARSIFRQDDQVAGMLRVAGCNLPVDRLSHTWTNSVQPDERV